MKRSTVVLLLLPLLFIFSFCSREPADLNAAIFLYEQNELEQALPMLRDLADLDPSDPVALAYLAETYRRFGKNAEAVATARRALGIMPCNAFAHTVIAEASNPLVGEWEGADPETTWTHLVQATECDPRDGNPWLILWGESLRRGDREMMTRAAEKMIETGFFPKALLSYTEWVLRSLPENAILITNGDMDTYPVAALQEVEELRPDVVMVNRGMLNLPWCARYLRDVKGVPLPFSDAALDELVAREESDGVVTTPSDDIIRGWIDMWKQGKMRNPVAFAMTVPSTFAESFREPLQYAGAVWLVRTDDSDETDIATISGVLEEFTAEDYFGPWTSEQDRSPVRRIGTKNIVRNVTYAALTAAEHAQAHDDTEGAKKWLAFAEELDQGSDLGPVYSERIAAARSAVDQ